MRNRLSKTLPWATTGTLVIIPLVVLPAAQAAEEETHTAAGVSSEVTVFNEDSVDSSKPVGLAVYLDGDGQYQANRPNGSTIQKIAAAAAEQNMVLAVPVSPDKSTRTWWRDGETNGEWVRSLINKVIDEEDVDRNRIHLIGYSGGAQKIANDLLANNPDEWMLGGGATIIGGGGPGGRLQDPPSGELAANLELTWYTNAGDVAGATNAGNWSALADARRGEQAYQNAGVEDAEQVTLDGRGHSYDVAELAARDLEQLYSDTSRPSTKQNDDPQGDNGQQPSADRQEQVGQMPQIVEREPSTDRQDRDVDDQSVGDLDREETRDQDGRDVDQARAGDEQQGRQQQREVQEREPTPVEQDGGERSLWEALRDLVQRTDPTDDQPQQWDRSSNDDGQDQREQREPAGVRSAPAEDRQGRDGREDVKQQSGAGSRDDAGDELEQQHPARGADAREDVGQAPAGDEQQNLQQQRQDREPAGDAQEQPGADDHNDVEAWDGRDRNEESPTGEEQQRQDREPAVQDPARDDDRRDDVAVDDRQQREPSVQAQEQPSGEPQRDQQLVLDRDPTPDRAPDTDTERDQAPTGTQEPSQETVSVWEALRDLLRRVGID